MHVEGYNGQVTFDGKSVVISRKGGLGFLSQGLKGDKTILISQITSVQFKKPDALTNGFIQFATAAGESRGNVFGAGTDENSVLFTKKSFAEFEELRKAIEVAMEERMGGGGSTESPLEALKKLKELLDMGVIDQKEFDEKKTKLMGKI